MNLKKHKILVTGAGGFIGCHLVEKLVSTGHDVRALVHTSKASRVCRLSKLPKEVNERIEIVAGDIRDPAVARAAAEGTGVIFHLVALLPSFGNSYSPQELIATNLHGTLNILQAAQDLKAERVLITSSAKVYGAAQYSPLDEKHPRSAHTPYAASKIAADYLAESYYRNFKVPVSIVRPFNTYGPGQPSSHMIPSALVQLLSGKTEISIGALHPTRDWLYIDDAITGFIRIAESETLIGEEVNIATGVETTMINLASKMIALTNPKARVVTGVQNPGYGQIDTGKIKGSSAKLFQHTGWKPVYPLEKGLKTTIDWLRKPENLQAYLSDAGLVMQ